ncbi:MAG: winged helix-turn-helix transcriptional regulator [Lentisphaerae bacterium]|nr:winged helix-turn-helix transcriptional regulator [Lentisphaerota bacterium]
MTVEHDISMSARADIFKALGHAARLAMVIALGKGERCVCELQEVVGSDMSTVSKHLTVLRAVGLVEADKRGKQVYYSLKLPCTLGFVECVDKALRERGH